MKYPLVYIAYTYPVNSGDVFFHIPQSGSLERLAFHEAGHSMPSFPGSHRIPVPTASVKNKNPSC